jgi:hypothetical protein
MKLLLLKILLQRRARDEGFTLPMVIALGLVMILLGAVSITIAHEENVTAISQNSRSDALAIAEIGVARYREMLDKNRNLAIYNRAEWTSNNVGGVNVIGQNCDVISATGNGWASNEPANTTFNAANWRAVNLNETIVGRDLNNNGDNTDTDAIIGWYKIVNYEYDNDKTLGDGDDNGNNFSQLSDANVDDDSSVLKVPVNSITDENDIDDDGQSDTKGILTVKGRSSDGSEAQIEVEIPIRINLDDMTNLAPALWIGNSGISTVNLGTLTIGNGNVVIKDQAVTSTTPATDGCRSFSALATANRPVISDSRDLPPIQKIVDDVTSARTDLTTASGSPINNPIVSSGEVSFGATTHKPYNPDSNTSNCPNIKLCRYYYDLPTSGAAYPGTENTNLLTDGIARTTLLLDRPLSISATSQDVRVGSTSTISNSDAFEIYVKDNDTVTTNFSTNTITINADSGRTVTINSFIHAPQSRLTITGTGTVNINGSVWVKDFVNTTATVNISPDLVSREPTPSDSSTSGRSYRFYSTTASRTPKPITGSPTNWKTEEVN